MRLPTVLLHHVTRSDTHYDWLLADPYDPAGELWTARVDRPTRCWASRGRWRVKPSGPHRRHYLNFEGDIGQGRGVVRRVDTGTAHATCWTASRITLDLRLRHFAGLVSLHRVSDALWHAKLVVGLDTIPTRYS